MLVNTILWWTDRLTDGQTTWAKTICLPTLKRGDIMSHLLSFIQFESLQTHMCSHSKESEMWLSVWSYPTSSIYHVSKQHGSGRTVRMLRLACAFAVHLCDKKHFHMDWLKYRRNCGINQTWNAYQTNCIPHGNFHMTDQWQEMLLYTRGCRTTRAWHQVVFYFYISLT